VPETAVPETATPETAVPVMEVPETTVRPTSFQEPFPEPVAASHVSERVAERAQPSKLAPQVITFSTLDRTRRPDAEPLSEQPEQGEPRRQRNAAVAKTDAPSGRITCRQELAGATADERVSTATAGERRAAHVSSRRAEARLGLSDRQQRMLTAIGRLIGESGEDTTRDLRQEGTAGVGTARK